MDLVILTGGLGQRLGAITQKKHKGALVFDGQQMLARILNQWLKIQAIDTIWVVTGHRCEDIRSLLLTSYSEYLVSRKLQCVSGPQEVIGTLRRLSLALHKGAGRDGGIVIGIDVLLAGKDIRSFTAYVKKTSAPVVLCVSDEIQKAPTHPAARLRGRAIIEYRTGSEQVQNPFVGIWHREVGVRYFSQPLCAAIQDATRDFAYLGQFISASVKRGESIEERRLSQTWIHLAVPGDFNQKAPK